MSGKYCFIVSTLLSAAGTTKTHEMQSASHHQPPSQVASFRAQSCVLLTCPLGPSLVLQVEAVSEAVSAPVCAQVPEMNAVGTKKRPVKSSVRTCPRPMRRDEATRFESMFCHMMSSLSGASSTVICTTAHTQAHSAPPPAHGLA